MILVVLPSKIREEHLKEGFIPSGYYADENMGDNVLRTFIGYDHQDILKRYPSIPQRAFYVDRTKLIDNEIEIW